MKCFDSVTGLAQILLREVVGDFNYETNATDSKIYDAYAPYHWQRHFD